MDTFYSFSARKINGTDFDFSSLKGKKVLVVNTASECGLTPQYEVMEEIYQKYKHNNFEIIAFPANNFGGQESGTNQEIFAFCRKNYGATFTVMEKISVKGEGIHPVYQWLTEKEKNGVGDYEVTWNFQKFMINEDGALAGSLSPKVSPADEKIIDWIEQE